MASFTPKGHGGHFQGLEGQLTLSDFTQGWAPTLFYGQLKLFVSVHRWPAMAVYGINFQVDHLTDSPGNIIANKHTVRDFAIYNPGLETKDLFRS